MIVDEKKLQQHLTSEKFNIEVSKVLGFKENDDEIAVLATSVDKRFVMVKKFFANVDGFHDEYQALANQIALDISSTIKICENIVYKTNILSDWSVAKSAIKPAIRPRKDDGFVRIPYLDLDIVFYVDLCEHLGSHFYVRKEDIQNWGVSSEELLLAANINSSKYYSSSVASECIHRIGYIPLGAYCCELFVVSSLSRKNGAYVMTQVEFLEYLANDFESDLVIFPSSIHEILVVPLNATTGTGEWFDEIIESINSDSVFPFDLLSSHHYLYKRGSLEVTYENNL